MSSMYTAIIQIVDRNGEPADRMFPDGLISKEATMKIKMRCVIGLAVVMTLCILGTGLAADKTLTITAGPMGGDWYSLGGALGEMAKEAMPGTVVTVTTGGAVENLPKINAGQADLGLSMAKLYHEALTGTESFAGRGKQENVRALAFLANIPMSFFLVKEGNPLASIEEIKAQKKKVRILTSKKGSSPALAAELMLGKYGITFEDIKTWGGSVSYVSYAEAANLIKDGHADAWIGPMVSGIVELTTTVKMKMLPISPCGPGQTAGRGPLRQDDPPQGQVLLRQGQHPAHGRSRYPHRPQGPSREHGLRPDQGHTGEPGPVARHSPDLCRVRPSHCLAKCGRSAPSRC